MTRPKLENGKGLSAEAFGKVVDNLRDLAVCPPDPHDLVDRWLDLCAQHKIVGKQSHDARLIAWMTAYNIETILTLNPRHFAPFTQVTVLTPTL